MASLETDPLLPAERGEEQNASNASPNKKHSSPIWIAIFMGCLAVLGILYIVGTTSQDQKPISEQLKTDAIFGHLEELYAIALEHNNSRSVTNGYMASAEYVQSQLRSVAGDFCDISIQEFKVPIWSELREPVLSSTGIGFEGTQVEYLNMVDFRNFRYGGTAATLNNQPIHVVHESGCRPKDHIGAKGKLVLVQENPACNLWTLSLNAEMAGATGILIYSDSKRKELPNARARKPEWEEGDPLVQIPVIAITHSLGSTLLYNRDSARVNIKTFNKMTVEPTINVLCTTKDGNEDNTIVVGAHLDSVPEGPGMVDNGSGATSLLEIALVLARSHFKLQNKVVFAWWGAEEIGLLGSRHYVRQIAKDSDKKKQIAMNMNFDMLASPNYVPFVHDGKTAPKELVGPSSKIDHLLIEHFKKVKEDYQYTGMVAGSDFLPFLLEGIPSGGLLTGAGGRKTMEQRTRFGGFANAPHDPCYHQSCDTLENVSKKALGLMSRTALYALAKVARAGNLREWLDNKDVQLDSYDKDI